MELPNLKKADLHSLTTRLVATAARLDALRYEASLLQAEHHYLALLGHVISNPRSSEMRQAALDALKDLTSLKH